jgi:hypothetical protein
MTYKEKLLRACGKKQRKATTWCSLSQAKFNVARDKREWWLSVISSERYRFKIKMKWLWDDLAEKLAKDVLEERNIPPTKEAISKLLDNEAFA